MTRLLISVRSSDEAHDALEGGANIIDVKEPERGALGRADWDCVESIYDAVGAQVPVSMACGELVEHSLAPVVPSLDYAKIGLAKCAPPQDAVTNTNNQATVTPAWRERWEDWIARIPTGVQPIAVIYADYWNASSPLPLDIIETSQKHGCRGVLIDTFRKQKRRSLFDWHDVDTISSWIHAAHNKNQFVALAGSLTAEHIPIAAGLGADIIALRGAACQEGRTSKISKQKARDLSNALAQTKSPRANAQRGQTDTQDGMSSSIF